ncbi:prepilin-type N-terminal cleavage/methylation domain-containing protein [Planococcus sp. N064]|uniref:Prepilin-type N-terminal cleavage/methylation domain-containing protein n=1 Tax=Planococcus liqunii TaxID=3058394 RepID=A0ABT8MQ08_9BACL|nr:prepilin-type N-terminal cleavage/methylation domain-containing protein [Planococcus sp. N064]MDN7226971.1 prepilin-type N-terminal cleavage/methylation domain-containing protein [Planococcus sp. N064]
MKWNQKGVTLVELLATLVIASLIVGIAWTALSIGMKHSAIEKNETHLQQEANLIITTLANAHRQNDYYTLRYNAKNQLEIQVCQKAATCNVSTAPFIRVASGVHDYTGTKIRDNKFDASTDTPVLIEPKKNHAKFTLQLDGKVKVNTTFTRIITD